MYDCWSKNLYGGLKAVERQLGIERHLKDVNGYEAVRLWWKYVDSDVNPVKLEEIRPRIRYSFLTA